MDIIKLTGDMIYTIVENIKAEIPESDLNDFLELDEDKGKYGIQNDLVLDAVLIGIKEGKSEAFYKAIEKLVSNHSDPRPSGKDQLKRHLKGTKPFRVFFDNGHDEIYLSDSAESLEIALEEQGLLRVEPEGSLDDFIEEVLQNHSAKINVVRVSRPESDIDRMLRDFENEIE